jgi:hypothetical protein
MKLPRFFTRKKKNQYNIPFEKVLAENYVPIETHKALEQRVEALEALKLSVNKEEELDVPVEVLERLPPEVRKIIESVMFCYKYEQVCADFCFMGMRKALIDAVRIRFMKDGKENMLYDADGNAYKLSRWIDLAKQERYITPAQASGLKDRVRIFGDTASHDFMADLHKEEVPPIFSLLRLALSKMYYEEDLH